jgi:smad nuclear-interacting protein 1
VIQYRKVKRRDRDGEPVDRVLPYLLDLQSAQKTFVNGEAVDDSRYYELREKDCIKFGASTREYVLMRDVPAPAPAAKINR